MSSPPKPKQHRREQILLDAINCWVLRSTSLDGTKRYMQTDTQWTFNPLEATIFRSIEVIDEVKVIHRKEWPLIGVTLDVCTLLGACREQNQI